MTTSTTFSQSPEQVGFDAQRLDRAYALLDDAVVAGELPSAVLLVARHGRPLAPRAFGRLSSDADTASTRGDTIFLVASVTKPVTATAAMLLVERGNISLETRVSDIVPEFGNRGKHQIRVRHLMTHTSGLPDMLPENEQLRKQHAPLSEFVRRICELELDFEPGTNIQYQSAGTAMLGAIVERIEGISLPAFLQRECFAPLGMADTALGAAGIDLARVAHVNVGPELEALDWSWNKHYWRHFGAPWGGMFTTAGDMFRFCQMFLDRGEYDGVQILSPATVSTMVRDQTGCMAAIPAQKRAEVTWGLGWRLGLRRTPAVGESYFGDLSSLATYGHGGATGTVVWTDPERELICILFTSQPLTTSTGLLARCSNLVSAAAL